MFNRENAIGLVLLLLCGIVALVLLFSIATGTRFRFEGPSWVGTALVILFIVVNRTQTEVSFIFTTVTMSLWIALTIAAVGGLIAGFLIGGLGYAATFDVLAAVTVAAAVGVMALVRDPKQNAAERGTPL